jgi:hypothetical protein
MTVQYEVEKDIDTHPEPLFTNPATQGYWQTLLIQTAWVFCGMFAVQSTQSASPQAVGVLSQQSTRPQIARVDRPSAGARSSEPLPHATIARMAAIAITFAIEFSLPSPIKSSSRS